MNSNFTFTQFLTFKFKFINYINTCINKFICNMQIDIIINIYAIAYFNFRCTCKMSGYLINSIAWQYITCILYKQTQVGFFPMEGNTLL